MKLIKRNIYKSLFTCALSSCMIACLYYVNYYMYTRTCIFVMQFWEILIKHFCFPNLSSYVSFLKNRIQLHYFLILFLIRTSLFTSWFKRRRLHVYVNHMERGGAILRTLFNIVEAPFKNRWTRNTKTVNVCGHYQYQDIHDCILPLNKPSGLPFILTQQSMGRN